MLMLAVMIVSILMPNLSLGMAQSVEIDWTHLSRAIILNTPRMAQKDFMQIGRSGKLLRGAVK